MNTSSMRGAGCLSIVVGIPAAIVGLVVLYAGMIYAFSPDVSAGRALVDRGTYHLTVFIFSIVFCVLACLPLWHGIDLLRTASKAEADAENYHPRNWHHHNTPVENTGGMGYDGQVTALAYDAQTQTWHEYSYNNSTDTYSREDTPK